ncbi:hypothetical protein Peetri_00157 [Pseudomonas phage vB_PpuM-Peetri]
MSDQEKVYVNLYSTAKHPIQLAYGPEGKDSVTLPPLGVLKRLDRDQLVYPLPGKVTEQIQA